jgi:AcrR family transcriptional regulator
MSEHVLVPRTSRGRRRRSSEALRSELLDSATQLFARHGVESVNSNQIARGAGVGVGSFYNQFSDKWEIHQAVMLRTLEELRDHLGREVAPASAPVEAQVRALVDSVLSFAVERPDDFRVAFSS